MKKRHLLGLLVLIVCLSLAVYWQYWLHSPQYSLLQAKEALEKHDLAAFKQYVDIEGVTSNLLDQLLEDYKAENKPSDPWEALGQSLAENMLINLKPELVSLAQDQIEYYVQKGSFNQQDSPTQTKPDFLLHKLSDKGIDKDNKYQGIDYVQKDGNFAVVGIKFLPAKSQTSLVLEVKMRKKEGHWQVIGLSNLIDLTEKM